MLCKICMKKLSLWNWVRSEGAVKGVLKMLTKCDATLCKTNTAHIVLFIIIYSALCQQQSCKHFFQKATVQWRHEYRTWFCTSVSMGYCRKDIKHPKTKTIQASLYIVLHNFLKEKKKKKSKHRKRKRESKARNRLSHTWRYRRSCLKTKYSHKKIKL